MYVEALPRRWLIAGCGYLGEAIGRHALKTGAARDIVGVRKHERSHTMPWRTVAANMGQPGWRRALPAGTYDCAVFCAAPSVRGMAAYRATYVDGLSQLLDYLTSQRPQTPRLILTSSTGVYGENAGGWVDEETHTEALTERIAILLAAEALAAQAGIPFSTLRLGGLYGPGRMRLLTQAQQKPLPLRPAPHFTNHIHRDDAARAVVHIASMEAPSTCYLATDNFPVDYNALLVRLATQNADADGNCQQLPQGQATGKRCNSSKLMQTGVVFAYPSYANLWLP